MILNASLFIQSPRSLLILLLSLTCMICNNIYFCKSFRFSNPSNPNLPISNQFTPANGDCLQKRFSVLHLSSSPVEDIHKHKNEKKRYTNDSNKMMMYTRDPRNKKGDPNDIAEIVNLINKRSEYKRKSYFQKADSIRDFLQSKHGVSINDKTRIWSTQWSSKSKKRATPKKNAPSSPMGRISNGDKQQIKHKPKQIGYQQIGEMDSNICQLSNDQIQTLLRERSQARRERNFQKADTILEQLKLEHVYVDDKSKQWRADGLPFDKKDDIKARMASSSSSYQKAPNSKFITEEDKEYVQQKLKERVHAKINRDFHLADDIRDELRYLKHVEINDDQRTWRKVDEKDTDYEHAHEYRFGGKRTNNVSDDELDEIFNKVQKRMQARKKKDFHRADAILQDLAILHGVRVDDKKMLWHFDGTSTAINDNPRFPKNDQRMNLKRMRKKHIQHSEDINAKDPNEGEETFPDGIVIPQEITIVE